MPDYLNITVAGGRLVITDYSNNEDGQSLIKFLEAMGIKLEVKCHSWCG